MSRTLRAAAAALLAAPLTACTILHSTAAPVQSYVLHAPTAPAGHASAAPDANERSDALALQVLHPLAAPGLDTDEIVVLQTGQRMDHYAASRWAVPLPDLVESLTVQTLAAQGTWGALEGSRGAFPAPFLLQLTIRRFEAEYAEGVRIPVAHVALEGMFVRRSDRAVIGTYRAEGSASAMEDRLDAVVAAFQQAADAALEELAAHTQQALQNVDSPRASIKR